MQEINKNEERRKKKEGDPSGVGDGDEREVKVGRRVNEDKMWETKVPALLDRVRVTRRYFLVAYSRVLWI